MTKLYTKSMLELIATLSLPGYGNAKTLKLQGQRPPVSDDVWAQALADAQVIVEECAHQGITILSYAQLPRTLQEIPSPPAILYVKGEPGLLFKRSVAVVGTRKPTVFGTTAAKAFVEAFAAHDFVIVSGLASGIDTAAHRAALDVGTPTVAVLGCGFNNVFPYENTALADEIVAAGGALVSEYAPDVRVNKHFLVARDRLQSALASCVCVMQTEVGGGTMHTVRFALQQGRPVAVPKLSSHLITSEPVNIGLSLLSHTAYDVLSAVAPAFSKIKRVDIDKPVATAYGREDLPDLVASLL